MKQSLLVLSTLILALLTLQACGGGESSESSESSASAPAEESGFTPFELEHGIGPITEPLQADDAIDPEMAERGRSIYQMKCEMCHNMEGRMVGPALGEVTERRSLEFIMNMILNPNDMARQHPEGQKMVQEYMSVMPFQNVSEDEARSIVEYLREYNQNR